ncbi:MAG: outer membrane protein assembly factor BamA [Gemmatimonas sp.]|nr:outer membrane protein assembly factor BamA [Gemmatimonas sp.]
MFRRSKALLPAILGAMLTISLVGTAWAQVPPPDPSAPAPQVPPPDSAAPGTPAPLPDPTASGTGVLVDSVDVRGNERMESGEIRVVAALQPGYEASRVDVQNAIRRLMATGNFETVQILSEGDPAAGVTLTIEVEERPYIVGFDIEGLDRVNPSTVRDTVGLIGNQPLNPQLVKRAERTIRDLLALEGVQLASLDTAMVPAGEDPNSYRLVFQVEEGNRLAVAEIDFEGNEAFDDEDLRDAIQTREEGFFWFRTGRFDRTTFQEDLLQNLPTFYGQSGYIDFTVVSDSMVIDPETGKARLVIAVNEGPQYRLGDFGIEGARRFPTDQIERMFTSRRRSVLGLPFGGRDEQEQGEIFDRAALDDATARVEQLYRNEGYLYVSVQPVVQRAESEDGDPVVNVTWAISEESPFYVNRVTIEGNTYTHESVIRDRVVVYPGDIYSEDRLIQSYRSIAALGFFETPLPEPGIEPNPEDATVDIVFRIVEKSTAQLSFGTAIGGGGVGRAGGVSGFLGVTQPNLFGRAKEVSVQAEYGYGRSSFTASYTDPALFGSRNSGSVSVFHTDDRYRGFSFSDGRYVRTGISLRYGFPILNFRWARGFAGYSLSSISYEAREADDCAAGSIFCQPSALSSSLSVGVTRDTKDHPLFPSVGTSQSLSLQQTGGPLGGDGNFQKLTGNADWWIPVGQLGGGEGGGRPIIITFGLQARAGALFGDAERFPIERFWLGGTQFGQPLRGYEESTLTPFGYFDRNSELISSGDRLGDAFLAVTGEYAIRFTDNLSLSVFSDAGGIWNDPAEINPSQLFRSVGIGAMVVTPFGPLGLDYAYGFDRTNPGWQFHFKINQPGF